MQGSQTVWATGASNQAGWVAASRLATAQDATGQPHTLAPVDMPLNMGVSSLAVFPLTHVSTVNPRDLLTTFSPCIRSISYFLLCSVAIKKSSGCGSSTLGVGTTDVRPVVCGTEAERA